MTIRKTQPENQKSQNYTLLRKKGNPVSRQADRTAETRVWAIYRGQLTSYTHKVTAGVEPISF